MPLTIALTASGYVWDMEMVWSHLVCECMMLDTGGPGCTNCCCVRTWSVVALLLLLFWALTSMT